MGETPIPLDHPGVMLLEDYLEPLGITQYQLAKAIGVQQTRISENRSGKVPHYAGNRDPDRA